MKIIILAGGTGKRFWPASRKGSPKQFQAVIGDKPLIRLKYDYLREGFKPEDIFLSTGKQYEKEVKELLPDLPDENFIFEPDMRDTGPAIALAAAYVDKKHPGEVISLQWSDHYIKKPQVFVTALKEAEPLVINEQKTVIICEKPRFASPHRGYVKFGNKIKNLDGGEQLILSEFLRFVEKPTQEVAHEYVRSGDFSWNLGYFVTTYDHIQAKYESFAPKIQKTVRAIVDSDFDEEVLKNFSTLEKISFDYIFAENLNPEETLVINTDMGWNDVGEWISLKEALEASHDANVIQGNAVDLDSTDTLIYNSEDKKLVATINLNGMIVVNTSDVVAIFHKNDNDKLKKFLAHLAETGNSQYL